MEYVISDIHGCYQRFKKLLGEINFSEKEDVLYLAGGLTGEGEDSLGLLLDLCMRPNVYPLWGDEDYLCAEALRALGEKLDEDALKALLTGDKKEAFTAWLASGGVEIIRDFRALSEEKRVFVLEYFDEFEPYTFTKVGKHVFIILHAGFQTFEEGKELEEYSAEELAFGSLDYNRRYFHGAYLVTGHKPTRELSPDGEDKVYKTKAGNIAVNCSVCEDGKLACLSLDTGKVVYA